VTILALDTTSELGGVAIRSGGKNVGEISVHAPDGFAQVIFSAVEEVLSRANLRLEEIDCFAAASGPGSFTGVRVGLSAVKGLAEAMGKPAVGISNLKALALFGSSPLRATILDARRGQAYAAVYSPNLEPVVPEAVLKFPDWLETLEAAEFEFITVTGSPFRSSVEGTRFAEMPWIEVSPNLSPAIAQAAESSEWSDPAVLDANYVRRSDAELFWKDER
jgi:tRNA threonylcarbamoyladenosine biosynthesis protein TsaB